MMNCYEATRLISESQERDLSVSEKVTLRVHILMCTGCKNFSVQIPFLGQAMRAFANYRSEDEDEGKE